MVLEALDTLVALSPDTDRAQAAARAIERGLPVLLREANDEAARQVRACPRCSAALFGTQAGNLWLQGCSRCGGIWLDHSSAQKVTDSFCAEAVEMAARATKNASHQTDTEPVVACPVCSDDMRRDDMKEAGVRIDICDKHGTWFDAGELDKVFAVQRKRIALDQTLAAAEFELRARWARVDTVSS